MIRRGLKANDSQFFYLLSIGQDEINDKIAYSFFRTLLSDLDLSAGLRVLLASNNEIASPAMGGS